MAELSISVLGSTDKFKLSEAIYGQDFNGPLVHECVLAELAARRAGTASTKTRGMVRGGGAKPWRQKGTGRARAGSNRSPIWTGGGTVFGPSPRSYVVKVNRKARRAAMRSVLSAHVERGTLFGINVAGFEKPSTKQAVGLLNGDKIDGSVLVILTEDDMNCARSFLNLANARVMHVHDAGIAELMSAGTVIASRAALDLIELHAAVPEKRVEVA